MKAAVSWWQSGDLERGSRDGRRGPRDERQVCSGVLHDAADRRSGTESESCIVGGESLAFTMYPVQVNRSSSMQLIFATGPCEATGAVLGAAGDSGIAKPERGTSPFVGVEIVMGSPLLSKAMMIWMIAYALHPPSTAWRRLTWSPYLRHRR